MGKHMDELARMMLGPDEGRYNAPFKEKFSRVGKKAMQELSELLELREIDIHFNRAGPACSGDLRLMGMWSDGNGVYVSMNKDFPNKPCGDVLYRTIKDMQDYTGGCNNYFKFELLRHPDGLRRLILTLRKGGDDEERQREREYCEDRKSDDHAHPDV